MMFKKAFWVIFSDGTHKFKCFDAVYAWVHKEKNKFHYKVALNMKYGAQTGSCNTLDAAKKLSELLVIETRTTLYQQEQDKIKKDIDEYNDNK